MSRPESTLDFEAEEVEIAVIQLNKMADDPCLLAGYSKMLAEFQKSGVRLDVNNYRGVTIYRAANLSELDEQLRSKQATWDEGKKQYDIYASVGKCEHNYDENAAKRWAEAEELPWPPAHEPISSFDAVINSIDEVTA